MDMRPRSLMASALALAIIACSTENGSDSGNLAETEANGVASAPADSGADAGPGSMPNGSAPPAERPAPQPPVDNGQAPQPSGPVTLSAAPTRTTQGAMMTLTLRNGSRDQVGYNLCTSAIETAAGRPVPTGRICTMELRTLNPGRSVNYSYELPETIADGNYRFLTQVERMPSGRRDGIRSNGFEIR